MSSSGALLAKIVRLPLSLIPCGAEVRVLRGPLRGMRWIKGSGPNACWFGTYEVSRLRTFANLIGDGAVVYDVGANVGIYSLLASLRAGPSGRVYAFEPLERNLGTFAAILPSTNSGIARFLNGRFVMRRGRAHSLPPALIPLWRILPLAVNCVFPRQLWTTACTDRPTCARRTSLKSMLKARSSKYWKAAIASSPNSTLRFFSRSTARSYMPTTVRFYRKRVIASTKDTRRSQLLLDYDKLLVRL